MKHIEYFSVRDLAGLEPVTSWLSRRLKPGDSLGLAGPLGAGKTTLTQGLAARFGVTSLVDSPTFTLRQSYRTQHATIAELIHYDFYRLETTEALAELGLNDDWQRSDCLLVIEWIDKFPELLEKLSYLVTMTINQKTQERILKVQTGENS